MGRKQSEEVAYTKKQIVQSARFTPMQRDVLTALLDDEATYTVAEANQILKQFTTKEVV